MKKTILIICIMLISIAVSYADIIPENSHSVKRTVTITGLSAYSEIQLVGYITGPMIQGYQLFEIRDGVKLEKGYKFNEFLVYAVKNSLVEAKGGLAAIDFSQVVPLLTPAKILDPGSYYVPDTNPLCAETVVYKMAGYSGNTLILYVAKRTLEYNNGAEPKTFTYTYNP